MSSAIKSYDKKYEKKIKVIPQGFNFAKLQKKISLEPINKTFTCEKELIEEIKKMDFLQNG